MMAALTAQAQVKLGIAEQARLRELRTELRQTDVFQFKKNTAQRAKELIGGGFAEEVKSDAPKKPRAKAVKTEKTEKAD